MRIDRKSGGPLSRRQAEAVQAKLRDEMKSETPPSRKERVKARGERWKEALARHHGNIAHAAKEWGFSKARGSVLTERYGLHDFMVQLKEEAGQPRRGRPRTRTTPRDSILRGAARKKTDARRKAKGAQKS